MFLRSQEVQNNKNIVDIKAKYINHANQLVRELVVSLDTANISLNADLCDEEIDYRRITKERIKFFASNIALAESLIKSLNKTGLTESIKKSIEDDIILLCNANNLIANSKDINNLEKHREIYRKSIEQLDNRTSRDEHALTSSINRDSNHYTRLRNGLTVSILILEVAAFVVMFGSPIFLISTPIALLAAACALAVVGVLLAISHGIEKGIIGSSKETNNLKDKTKRDNTLRLFDEQMQKHFGKDNKTSSTVKMAV